MECYCYLRNVHDNMANGKTAFEKRDVHKFDGPSILFGTLVEYSRLPRRTSQEYIRLVGFVGGSRLFLMTLRLVESLRDHNDVSDLL